VLRISWEVISEKKRLVVCRLIVAFRVEVEFITTKVRCPLVNPPKGAGGRDPGGIEENKAILLTKDPRILSCGDACELLLRTQNSEFLLHFSRNPSVEFLRGDTETGESETIGVGSRLFLG
jgi:hypothetical protein